MAVNFEIETVNALVQIRFGFDIPHVGNWIYFFSHDCGSKHLAGFIADAIETQFQDAIKAIREDAYNEGYKAGKGHERKCTHFNQCFNYLAKKLT